MVLYRLTFFIAALLVLLFNSPLLERAHAEPMSLLMPISPKETDTPSFADAAIFFLEQIDNVPRAANRYVSKVTKATGQDVSNSVTYWKQIGSCAIRKTAIETNVIVTGDLNPGRTLGMGNVATVTEYDLTKIGVEGKVDAQDGSVYLTFKEKPGFCKNLMPKNYTSPDADGYRVWGHWYGSGPQHDPNDLSAYFRATSTVFYTDYFFGDPSLVSGKTWYVSTDEKVHAWLLERYKQRLRQDINLIADGLDTAEYTGKPCDLDERRYILDISRGIEYGKEKVQRITKARDYLKQAFQCNYDEGPKKPY